MERENVEHTPPARDARHICTVRRGRLAVGGEEEHTEQPRQKWENEEKYTGIFAVAF